MQIIVKLIITIEDEKLEEKILIKEKPFQFFVFVTDGNPSYQATINYIKINNESIAKIVLRNVIGLQNIGQKSTDFRPYNKMIKRLNINII